MTNDIPAQNKCAKIKLKLTDVDDAVVVVLSLLISVVFVVMVSAVIFNLLSCPSLVVSDTMAKRYISLYYCTVRYRFFKSCWVLVLSVIYGATRFTGVFVFPGGFCYMIYFER